MSLRSRGTECVLHVYYQPHGNWQRLHIRAIPLLPPRPPGQRTGCKIPTSTLLGMIMILWLYFLNSLPFGDAY